jgi:type IV secretion system protein VirB6/type IV secretion system protein TrbL
MMNQNNRVIMLLMLIAMLLLISTDASAALDNQGVLDRVVDEFAKYAGQWKDKITTAATYLFWALVTISMIWTFGIMALRQADLMEFFAELMKFVIFTGFFLWLLENGPAFSMAIINSLMQLGGQASGTSDYFTPSKIVDIGFEILFKAIEKSSVWAPVDSALCILAAFIILLMMALIAINMLMLVITAWVLAYAGIFILGFGGSRWTSDIAITYYKQVLGIGVQIFTMVLIIGVGRSIIDNAYGKMENGLELGEMGVLIVVVLVIYNLANTIPALLAGIVTGPTGGPPIGQTSGATVASSMSTAAGKVAGAAGMAWAGGKMMAGGASRLMKALKSGGKGGTGSSGDMGKGSSAGGGSSGSKAGASQAAGTGNTPYAQAGGFANKD